MERWIAAEACRRAVRLAAAVMAVLLMGGVGVRLAGAQTFSTQSDDWKGSTLDLARWHAAVLGNAQLHANSVEVSNGALKITVAGSDIWDDNDNGFFMWQPMNGDFQAQLEVRTLKMVSGTTAVGIMVRQSLDLHSAEAMAKAMPVGTHLHFRPAFGEATGPGSGDAGRLDWGDGSGNGPTILLRLTRTGNTFKSERSDDGGKTWGPLHDKPESSVIQVTMPDDVLVGIAAVAVTGDAESEDTTEAVVGPFTFTSLATRPTQNGLVAVTAVDANNKPVAGGFLIVKKQGGDVVGTTKNDTTDPATSNTGSFFLPPGMYTVETGETDTFAAGTPVPFEIKTGQRVVLSVAVGKAK